MHERGGDQAARLDLADAVAAEPGERRGPLEPGDRVATAASCAASIWRATSAGASAHSADTLLTGEKVRSNPATRATRRGTASR